MMSASCCEGSRATSDRWTASPSDCGLVSCLSTSVRMEGADVQVCAPSCTIGKHALQKTEHTTYNALANGRDALRVTRDFGKTKVRCLVAGPGWRCWAACHFCGCFSTYEFLEELFKFAQAFSDV